MKKRYFKNPNYYFFLSVLLWFASLFFPALTTVDSRDTWYGYCVLLLGWYTLFQLNPAWLANFVIIYIFSCFHYSRSKFITASWLMLIMSLTTFLFKIMFVWDGNAYVFGYGWGALLWFSSIFLLAIAIGLRLIHIAKNGEFAASGKFTESPEKLMLKGKRIYTLGLILLILHTGYAGIKGATDHLFASTWEKERLLQSKTVYKRGWICSKEIKTKSLNNFSGVLKITGNFPQSNSRGIDPLDFLRDGIDTIIIDDFEYQYAPDSSDSYKIQPQTQTPTAELIIDLRQTDKNENTNPVKAQLFMTLKMLDTGNIIFDESWDGLLKSYNDKETKYFIFDECSYPDPRELLKKANEITIEYYKNQREKFVTFENISVLPSTQVSNQNKSAIQNSEKIQNINCPEDTRLIDINDYPYIDEIWFKRTAEEWHRTVLKNSNTYYALTYKNTQSTQLFCAKNALYIHGGGLLTMFDTTDPAKMNLYKIELDRNSKSGDSYGFNGWKERLVNLIEKDQTIELLFYNQTDDLWITYELGIAKEAGSK